MKVSTCHSDAGLTVVNTSTYTQPTTSLTSVTSTLSRVASPSDDVNVTHPKLSEAFCDHLPHLDTAYQDDVTDCRGCLVIANHSLILLSLCEGMCTSVCHGSIFNCGVGGIPDAPLDAV